jgi:hypothetical protein
MATTQPRATRRLGLRCCSAPPRPRRMSCVALAAVVQRRHLFVSEDERPLVSSPLLFSAGIFASPSQRCRLVRSAASARRRDPGAHCAEAPAALLPLLQTSESGRARLLRGVSQREFTSEVPAGLRARVRAAPEPAARVGPTAPPPVARSSLPGPAHAARSPPGRKGTGRGGLSCCRRGFRASRSGGDTVMQAVLRRCPL